MILECISALNCLANPNLISLNLTKIGSILLAVLVLGTFTPGIFAASDNSEIQSTARHVIEISLTLAEESVQSSDYDSAKTYANFASSFFGKNLNELRESNPQVIDDIHITLLDVQSGLSGNDPNVSSKINSILDSVESIPYPPSPTVAVNLLSLSDQAYQNAILDDDQASYLLAINLATKSQNSFSYDSFGERTSLELKSFFADLDENMSQKSDFVTVGTIITTIQRDLMGTEVITSANDNLHLYDVIRDLYTELNTELDSGNYDKAEELAIEAYLENFEYLEHDIELVNEDLLYALEIDMREVLRDMIKKHKSKSEISSFIDGILIDLAEAESLVKELKAESPESFEASAMPVKELAEMGSATDEQKSGVRGEIDFIRDSLQTMLVQYENGDYQAAYTTARTAYLDSYEHVEIPLRTIDPDFTMEVELQFATLRSLIEQKADYSQVQEAAIAVKRNLDESERLVSGTGELAPTIAFTSSFSIIFREGLESVLILGAIITYLEASRNIKYKKFVYYGIILAIAATAVTWFVASFIVEISGANRELVEAIAALSATAVLFYVSFWILNKIEHKKWMEFVKAKVWQASATGGTMVFVMLSFFTVYREGFETVLFYQAMFSFAKYMEVFVGAGFLTGILSLLVVYFVMRKLGKRLPLRALFGLTMGVGAYLSVAFLGNAIRELQTLDIIPYTNMMGIIPRLDINLATMTGIYPTLETVIAQVALLAVYLVASSYVLIIRPKKEKALMSMRKSRAQVDD